MDKLTGTFEIFNSVADIYGNRYWAFYFHDNKSNKTVAGKISGDDSNIRAAAKYLAGDDWEEMRKQFVILQYDLKIRQYNRITKNFKYAGCCSEGIAEFIVNQLKQS